ncbi:MAG: pirin family protein [Parvularculaceae bacterium]
MITIRKSIDRGRRNHGWLDARHTFSFGDYRDPAQMGFRSLRVINEDVVAPGAGFAPHSHRDMEIVTYVLEGGVKHEDSTGGGGVIRPGEVQYMCAGSGVTHSEVNASPSEPLHLLQIWLLPNAKDLKPGYAQKSVSAEIDGRLAAIVSGDGRDGSIKINQDTVLYAARLKEGQEVVLPLAAERFGWLQIARGGAEIGGAVMQAGDGARFEAEAGPKLKALGLAEILFFDLP